MDFVFEFEVPCNVLYWELFHVNQETIKVRHGGSAISRWLQCSGVIVCMTSATQCINHIQCHASSIDSVGTASLVY